MKLLVLIFVMFLMVACVGEPFLNLKHSSVKLMDNGDFEYDFKYTDDCLYGDYIKVCAKKKLESLDLVPKQCVNGIEVLKKGGPNNGWVFVTFRCGAQ